MSMNSTVYIGPYIATDGVADELIESFEEIVCNGQGEATDWDSSKRYLIPNKPLAGVYRTMNFDKNDSPEVFPITDFERERIMFLNAATPFLNQVWSLGLKGEVLWGVVVGVF